MTVLAQGEINEGTRSVFITDASILEGVLTVRFEGSIRADNPSRHLETFLGTLSEALKSQTLSGVILDFVALKFCNSNGFYAIMDIVETIYTNTSSVIVVRRINDDWQQETLPILLNLDEQAISNRTQIEEITTQIG